MKTFIVWLQIKNLNEFPEPEPILEEKTQNRPTLVLLMVFREICSKHHLGLP
jgi:hypothetical protein